ncbi:hypothetical protein QTI33_32180 [Variovorax sp. J22P271]|nr:hypothetical protein [Variovorax sp. J22P271]MDM0036832.1 hypothetical protein [Variovorax sp. J22P271]
MEAGVYVMAAISWVQVACVVKQHSNLEREVKLQLQKTIALIDDLPPLPR